MGAIVDRHCRWAGAGLPSGGVTATTMHRWAGAFATKAPPETYFAISAVFHYLGPAFAVLLFVRVDVLGVAWLRIAAAGLVFALWRRPWRVWRHLDAGTRRLVLPWGAVLAGLKNAVFPAIHPDPPR